MPTGASDERRSRTAAAGVSGWARRRIEALLSRADVRIDGDRPWDVRVRDPRLYRRVLLRGPLGLGEAYMDGWWECPALDELVHRLLGAELWDAAGRLAGLLLRLRNRLLNFQRPSRAFQIGERHYDVGNDLFAAMLGPTMVYSEGYWAGGADDLERAQEAKLERACRALRLEPGMRLLDIGCGWGTTLRYAAQQYGIQGVGITVSRRQHEYARQVCADVPVDIRRQDYRDLDEAFDRVVSLGMLEHVGHKNWRTYMRGVRRCLRPQGLFHLSVIGKNRSDALPDPWIARYIFPNSELPSPAGLGAAVEGLFVLEDWRNRGADYDRTLIAWYENLRDAWASLADRYDERFRRMWRYYLLSCAGAFRARSVQLWELVLSPRGVAGGYRPAEAGRPRLSAVEAHS